MSEATRLLWQACGDPAPCDVLGTPIPCTRTPGAHCARCGSAPASYDVRELISANFLPTKNANRISAFGGRHFCGACVFAARTLRLRCMSWFASAAGLAFWRTRPAALGSLRPDALEILLSPPAPPFVVGIPAYGIAHGGEAHSHRTWWPGESTTEPLIKLQSKHVAIYARTACSRDRYPVQVDDAREFVLERDTWLRARDDAAALMAPLISDGVPPWRAKRALFDLAIPQRVSLATARAWPQLTSPLRCHGLTVWWPLFCDLVPALESPHAKT